MGIPCGGADKGPIGTPEDTGGTLPCVEPCGLLEPGPVLMVIPGCVLEGVMGLFIGPGPIPGPPGPPGPQLVGGHIGGRFILLFGGPQLFTLVGGSPFPPGPGPIIGPFGPLIDTGGPPYIGPLPPLLEETGGPPYIGPLGPIFMFGPGPIGPP